MKKIIELAKKKGVEAEVLMIKHQVTNIQFQDGKLNSVKKNNLTDFSLRVLNNGKLGVIYGSKAKNREKLVDAAIDLSKAGRKVDFHFSNHSKFEKLKLTSGKTKKLNISDLKEIGDDVKGRMKKFMDIEPDITISTSNAKTSIATTNGTNISQKQTTFVNYFMVKIPASGGGIYEFILDIKPGKIKDKALKKIAKEYKLFKKSFTPETGTLPVIFAPNSFSTLIYSFLTGISGDNLVKNISPLKNKLNEQIFSPKLTILDDPLKDKSIHSTPFDNEGIPTTTKYLVENGILKSFLYDLYTASKLNTTSTGNGFKYSMFGSSISTPISPFSNSIYVSPGDKSEKELISSVEKGLYIKQVMGFHSGDYRQGRFSVSVGIGYYIEKGKLKGRLVNTMIAGNIYDVLKNIIDISKETKDTELGKFPWVLLEKVNVSGK